MSTSDNHSNNHVNKSHFKPSMSDPSHNIYHSQMHPLACTSIASYSSPDLTRFRRRSLPSMQKLRDQARVLPPSSPSVGSIEDLSIDAQETNAAAGALWGSVHFFKGLQTPSPKLISPWTVPPHPAQLQQSNQHLSDTALDAARQVWTFRSDQWKNMEERRKAESEELIEDSPGSQQKMDNSPKSKTSPGEVREPLNEVEESRVAESTSLDDDHNSSSGAAGLRKGSPVGSLSSSGPVVDVGKIDPDADPVIQLSQLCQRHRWVYQFSAVTPGVSGGFQCKCIVGSLIFPDGWGTSQEESVRVAAQQALNAISYVRGPEQEQGSPGVGGTPTAQQGSGTAAVRSGNGSNNSNSSNGNGNSNNEEEIRERVRKSAYCRHFKARGWCSFGNNCRFIHGALIGLDDFSPAVTGNITQTATQAASSSTQQQQQQHHHQQHQQHQHQHASVSASTNVVTTSLSNSGSLSASKTTGMAPNKTAINVQTVSVTPSMAAPVSNAPSASASSVNAGGDSYHHRDQQQQHYVRFEDEVEKFGVPEGDVSSGDVMDMLGWLGSKYQEIEIDNQRLRSENRRLVEEVNGLRSQLAKVRMYG